MKHYVGSDVSLKEISICVVVGDGVVAAEGTRPVVRSILPAGQITERQMDPVAASVVPTAAPAGPRSCATQVT